ncbi:MAG TPA: alpha/beta fold hydrolase [Ktedonobacterales bacterium]|jgi:pimeloyl-ACP methyl ester carboxylesterase
MEHSSLAYGVGADAPWTEQFVRVNGITLHIVEAGPTTAPLVLLLHGFPDHCASWRFQLPALADRYRVVAPDLRGYNLSDKPAWGYDVATLAADIRELIYALGYHEAAIVGHDWGGFIAWVVGIREPEVVRKLAILNAPHPAMLTRGWKHPGQLRRSAYIALFQLRGIAERAIERENYALLWQTLRAADRGRAWLTDDDIQRNIDAIRRPGALSAALEYYRQLPHALAQASPMRVIHAPTLLLWGELDPYLGPWMADELEPWAPDLHVKRLPTLGHWPHLQAPEHINAALQAFL